MVVVVVVVGFLPILKPPQQSCFKLFWVVGWVVAIMLEQMLEQMHS